MTTNYIKIKSCLLFLSFWCFSQNVCAQEQYERIPLAYRSHPEIGKTTHSASLHEVDYELVQDRTKYSRTFLNTNTTKTTVQSSVPLHYQDKDGVWHSIDYNLTRINNKIVYPAQNPFFELNADHTSIAVGNKHIKVQNQSSFVFISNSGEVSKKVTTARKEAVLEENNKISLKSILPNLDKQISVYNQALKIDYQIKNVDFLPESFNYMLVEEIVDLPSGFSIKEDKSNGNAINRLTIINEKGEEALILQQPLISDSKVNSRNFRQLPYEAKYHLIKVSENRYKIQIQIDGSWLKSTDRVYPINIDPVVTVNNTDAVNSCFSPNYQQSTLQVAVPAGETVLSSDITYDFVAVAGSGAYMSDQRSFVSGPSGQTPVTNGVGNSTGTYTYNLTSSPIANGVSTGTVDFTFNFSRTWGGNACDAAFNFVDSREVAVTYGTIQFGTGPLLINEYSASNRNFNDGFNRNEDWIELYNSSPDSYFNLAGYHLSNNIDNPTKWQIQNGVIPPNSRVLIFCSSRDISSGTVLHANFDLTQTDSDQVVLADPSGAVLESHDMYITQTNHSYGRTSNGASTWSVFTTPSPGQSNVNGFSGYSTKPTFGTAPGNYPGPISVSLSTAGTNEQIRYTTNGSTPTATSTLYTGPITVNQSTVLRARTFSTVTGILPGFIETNTYFVNENSSLPVFSLSGDPDLLGLLNGNAGLVPTGYAEYFEGGNFIDENMGDFDAHGNDSWAYSQRGIDFVSRDDHGYKRRFDHNFFNTTGRDKFRRLIIKAAGSDNYPGQTGGAHFRDVFVQTLSHVSDLELDERSATFVSLF
ncbi:MAG TPA: chitobiase/beta-hexosaminidase C-terminal domain-containing protein, partial [Flavobacterium sp.]